MIYAKLFPVIKSLMSCFYLIAKTESLGILLWTNFEPWTLCRTLCFLKNAHIDGLGIIAKDSYASVE